MLPSWLPASWDPSTLPSSARSRPTPRKLVLRTWRRRVLRCASSAGRSTLSRCKLLDMYWRSEPDETKIFRFFLSGVDNIICPTLVYSGRRFISDLRRQWMTILTNLRRRQACFNNDNHSSFTSQSFAPTRSKFDSDFLLLTNMDSSTSFYVWGSSLLLLLHLELIQT